MKNDKGQEGRRRQGVEDKRAAKTRAGNAKVVHT